MNAFLNTYLNEVLGIERNKTLMKYYDIPRR